MSAMLVRAPGFATPPELPPRRLWAVEAEKILIVDDEPLGRQVVRKALEKWGFSCVEAGSAEEALGIVARGGVGLCLLDVSMPGMSGIDLLSVLSPRFPEICVVMMTALKDDELVDVALERGALGYIEKPVSIISLRAQVISALARRQAELEARRERTELEARVKQQAMQIAMLPTELAERFAVASDLHHGETGAHVRRIGRFSSHLARLIGHSDAEADLLGRAAVLHDVGKLVIPDEILLKPGKLTPEEFEVMKTHTTMGARILEGVDLPLMSLARSIAVGHHERWDGSGYPHGLHGTDCPLEARLVGILDVFDALGQERVYKTSWSREQILAFFKDRHGKLFDPELIDVFLMHYDEFEAIGNEVHDPIGHSESGVIPIIKPHDLLTDR